MRRVKAPKKLRNDDFKPLKVFKGAFERHRSQAERSVPITSFIDDLSKVRNESQSFQAKSIDGSNYHCLAK